MKTKCPICDGSGRVFDEEMAEFDADQAWVECAHCDGTGEVEDERS